MPLTCLLADDQPVLRAGLRVWLEGAGIAVMGETADGREAERLTRELRPSVLVCGLRLEGQDGLECLRRLRAAGDETPTLFLTGEDNPTYAARAAALGASGLAPRTADRDALVASVRRAAEGENLWTASEVRRYTGPLSDALASDGAGGPALTAREGEVLKQLAFGLSNKEIAQALGISYETAKEHVQHILRKLGVADRTQAAVWAVRRGLV